MQAVWAEREHLPRLSFSCHTEENETLAGPPGLTLHPSAVADLLQTAVLLCATPGPGSAAEMRP